MTNEIPWLNSWVQRGIYEADDIPPWLRIELQHLKEADGLGKALIG
jgi:hypothetical protein